MDYNTREFLKYFFNPGRQPKPEKKEVYLRPCRFPLEVVLEGTHNSFQWVSKLGFFHRFTKEGKAIVEDQETGYVHLIECEKVSFIKQ